MQSRAPKGQEKDLLAQKGLTILALHLYVDGCKAKRVSLFLSSQVKLY
jgi:hypothetical protein